MTHKIVAIILILFAGTAFSEQRGRVVIVGNGERATAPEYTNMQVVVTAMCYDTSREAKDANAELANKLIAILKEFTSDPRDKVTALGGANVRQTETIAVGNQFKTLCERKWRATNTLNIRMDAIENLADLQDRLLGAIDQFAGEGVDPNRTAQTFAELGQPFFNVYDETLAKLRNEAQQLAYKDARVQFEGFANTCKFQDVRMNKIQTPRQVLLYKHHDRITTAAETPIIPDQIIVSVNWEFEWTFVPSAECY